MFFWSYLFTDPQVHSPSWMHHQSYLMQPAVSIDLIPACDTSRIKKMRGGLRFAKISFFCGLPAVPTFLSTVDSYSKREISVYASTGYSSYPSNGSCHVHPAHIHDGTSHPAAKPPVTGQHRHGQYSSHP